MISLRAIQLLLNYFDGIDKALSARMTRKRPWPEEALTAALCDLMDSETQEEEGIHYSLDNLLTDLSRTDEPLGIGIKIETHQYPKQLERYVTQSDIGMIVRYENQFDSGASSTSYWLLQAKRLFPDSKSFPVTYTLKSVFASRNTEQEERMKLLNDWAGIDFVRYLLYCPRPAALPTELREALNQFRTMAVSTNIFDYALGLQLREDILSDNPTIAAGMFIAGIDNCPSNFSEAHRTIFSASIPFSWFLVQHFAHGGSLFRNMHDEMRHRNGGTPRQLKLIERIVRGDHRVLDDPDLPESLSQNVPPRILPAHTIEIRVVCGIDRPRIHANG
jgi:hypothetical protein